MEKLPDELIYKIHKELPFKERARVKRVCKKWSRIASDKRLWSVIDIQPKQALNNTILKVLKSLASDCTKVLRITSYRPNQTPNKTYANPITATTWMKAFSLCSQLEELYLCCVDVSSLPVHLIPNSVKRLYFHHAYSTSDIPSRFWNGSRSLDLLDLTHCSGTLVRCFADDDKESNAIKYLALSHMDPEVKYYKSLTHLDLGNMPGVAYDLFSLDWLICTGLQYLGLGGCISLDTAGFFESLKSKVPSTLKLAKVCNLKLLVGDHSLCTWHEADDANLINEGTLGFDVIGCRGVTEEFHISCPLQRILPSPSNG